MASTSSAVIARGWASVRGVGPASTTKAIDTTAVAVRMTGSLERCGEIVGRRQSFDGSGPRTTPAT